MTTIDTTTSTTSTAYGNQRRIDRCQNGVVWIVLHDGLGVFEFHYSSNDGSTWTHDAAGDINTGGTTYTPHGSLFIDLDDYAHFVYVDGSDGLVYYQRGTPNAGRTAWTWSSASQLWSSNSSSDEIAPDVVAHRQGSGWVAHAVWSHMTATPFNQTRYAKIDITSGGTISAGSATTIGGNYAVSTHTTPSIDFNHTGDGKTVAGSTPHLYAAWHGGGASSTKGVRFRKAVYSGGSWTWGTERSIDDSNYASSGLLSGVFDGTRFLIAYEPSTSTTDIYVRERDAADTTTTSRTPTGMADGNITALSVTYDSEADIHLWAVGANNDDVERLKFDRSAGTWDGAWTTVAAADVLADTLTVKRGYSGSLIEAVYTTGTGSPYNVDYASLQLNRAPTAATWDLTDNQARDVASALALDWTFNDPDPGDTQSKYALRRQVGAESYEYYNAGTASWGASEVENSSATSAVTLAASWGSDGDANHKYAVKTWDAAGLVGSYSSELTVIPSTKNNPTLTAPTDAGTTTSSSVTLTWTVTTQTAYRCRLLDASDNQLATTGKVTSTATTYTFDNLSNSTTYKVEVVTWNDEGLQSDADTHTTTTSFTPPATPTLSAVGSDANGHITVTITNPGTGATEDYNDVFVRVASGGRQDLDRTVNDDGIRIATDVAVDGSFIDRAVASGVDYEYLVRAYATNGSSADSAWT